MESEATLDPMELERLRRIAEEVRVADTSSRDAHAAFKAKIVELHQAGFHYTDVIAAAGISHQRYYQILNSAGFKPRPRTQRKKPKKRPGRSGGNGGSG